MLFNSLLFVLFLPTVLLAVGALPRRWRNPILLVASYTFYGAWNWRFLGLIFASTLVDFWAARAIVRATAQAQRRRALLASIFVNLGILGFFKYWNFFIDSAATFIQLLGFRASLPTLSLVLPVGISFYTLQTMSYTIDVYQGKMKPTDRFFDFALYVAYFPQLVAGPIERARHLLPQIISPARVTVERVNIGLMLMMIGFTKKVLIADSVAAITDPIFRDPAHATSGMLWKAVYLFAFQIYCDFSGYSDIARGVSELLGIRLRINFEQPYLSRSVTEYWRRWHISLSSWLRDYLYIPLGGNRYGRFNTYRNLMLTMLIGGLWHGANTTFIVWGALNGLYLAVERALGIERGRSEVGNKRRGWPANLLFGVLTFHLILVTWIFFRSPNFTVALQYLGGMLAFRDLASVGALPLLVAAAVLLIDVPQYISGEHTIFLRVPWWIQSPLYAALCFAMILVGGREIPFIYFQF